MLKCFLTKMVPPCAWCYLTSAERPHLLDLQPERTWDGKKRADGDWERQASPSVSLLCLYPGDRQRGLTCRVRLLLCLSVIWDLISLLLCMSVFQHVCLYTQVCVRRPWRPEEELDPLKLGTDSCKLPWGCWELNLYPLEEQELFLTSDSSL